MKQIFAVLAAASVVCGLQYDGLRVKFGWSDALADIEYFFRIPRTSAQAEVMGWRRLARNDKYIKDLRLYCLIENKSVCALYDVAGFIAGLQVALPADDFEALAIKPGKRFYQWEVDRANEPGDRSRLYWAITQYFVSAESYKAGAGPQVENGATLQDGGVWVPGLDGRFMRIPTTEAELNTTDFKKQNCIPNMGTHYYYNMTPAMKCEDLLPWFALVMDGDLVGTGFQMFGKLARQPFREWFEDTPAPKQSVKTTIPHAPACLAEWAETYGVLSMHIYYIDKPWTIRCKSGDSSKPAPAVDRLLLNGYRYASQVSDEFKKIFSG